MSSSAPGGPAIVLASASPRRRELLAAAGLAFEVEPAAVEEDVAPGTAPEAAAEELARRKAAAVLARRRGSERWVVGADTIVALPDPAAPGGWRLLGKPEDEAEAAGMLRALSGSRHRVVTGVCVGRAADGALRSATETTVVTMRPLAPEEVAAYVASGEWRDKAGGYAIQETADAFVTGLEGGGFDTVVGLPVRLTLELLRSSGAPGVPARLAGDGWRG